MKIVGIIVEYNPLHNGHIYHIEKIREKANPDLIIAVMSSTMTMRGDLSIFDKFEKTKQALKASVDLVIELPLVYSMQRADIFASNAVSILNMCNVDEIWIGSEENNTLLYEKYYNELKKINISLKMKNEGISFKNATSSILPFKSNDILGFSYYKAIKDNNYKINLYTIKRESSDYLDKSPTNDKITSALAIRNNLSLINNYCPYYIESNNIINEEMLFPYIKYKILSLTKDELKNIFFVDEGIENNLYLVSKYSSLKDFINFLTTKRYTSTRIKRTLMYILFNIKKEDINSIPKPNYIRVLGYSKNGKDYLSKLKKNVNIYTNIKENINNSLDIEIKVTKIIDSIFDKNILFLEQKGPVTID